MIFKRILTGSFIIMICVMMLLTGYTRVTSSYCFADSNTDQWTQVTTNQQLVEAFKYYCKSRDVTIDGSIADGVTSFTTKTFNGLCNTLGIDVTALQAEIKYRTDTNVGLQYLFTTTGVSAYNRIFAQFLQDNDLSVGDTNVNKRIYSGKFLHDNHGRSCYLFVLDTFTKQQSSSLFGKYTKANILTYGTAFYYPNYESSPDGKYSISGIINGKNYQFGFKRISATSYPYRSSGDTSTFNNTTINGANTFLYVNRNRDNELTVDGYLSFAYVTSDNTYRLISYNTMEWNSTYTSYTNISAPIDLTDSGTTLNINVVSNTINNNNYDGDTIINNNGDTIVNQPIPDDPETPPYDPYPGGGGTTTPDDNVGGGDQSDDTNITFPNFEFNFPEIDWSIGDLSQKFPFSIPFDLIAFFTVLNAEPEAPKIDADIPLGNWYTWHFTADFSQFDRYASIVRHVEFISFVVALIYLTIRLVKG